MDLRFCCVSFLSKGRAVRDLGGWARGVYVYKTRVSWLEMHFSSSQLSRQTVREFTVSSRFYTNVCLHSTASNTVIKTDFLSQLQTSILPQSRLPEHTSTKSQNVHRARIPRQQDQRWLKGPATPCRPPRRPVKLRWLSPLMPYLHLRSSETTIAIVQLVINSRSASVLVIVICWCVSLI